MSDGEVNPGINAGGKNSEQQSAVWTQQEIKNLIAKARAFDIKLGTELDRAIEKYGPEIVPLAALALQNIMRCKALEATVNILVIAARRAGIIS